MFLSLFFFSKENRKHNENIFHGIMLLAMAGCIIEIYLMYTGYIVRCLYLVDFSEPLSFVIGPAFYLLVVNLEENKFKKIHYLHFVFPVIYLFLEIPFLIQSNDYKFNSWISSFHINLPYREVHLAYEPRMFWITDHHTEMALASLIIYAAHGLYFVYKSFRKKGESFLKPVDAAYKKMQAVVFNVVTASIVILIVKFFNVDDTGDHVFAAYISITVYLTSFNIIRHSVFFKQATQDQQQKYKSSQLAPEIMEVTRKKLVSIMSDAKPFLNNNFSLPDLADRVGVSVHHLSQVINEGLQKNFSEMVAEYRVEEAKHILKKNPHLKIEEVAEQVGYLSKSSFNTAFKKITGKTPSDFRAV
jgi:AraC-like DNA-binding protein